MGNMSDGYVEIVLDKPRRMRLDLNAMADFEKATGKNFMAMGEPTASDVRALLWACLRQEDEKITQHDVGKLVTRGNMEEVSKKMFELYGKAMPESKEKEGKKKSASPLAPKVSRPTG